MGSERREFAGQCAQERSRRASESVMVPNREGGPITSRTTLSDIRPQQPDPQISQCSGPLMRLRAAGRVNIHTTTETRQQQNRHGRTRGITELNLSSMFFLETYVV